MKKKVLVVVLLLGLIGIAARTLINLQTQVQGILPVANGGTGTSSPSLVSGSNVTVTGSWPNQTVAATGTGSTLQSWDPFQSENGFISASPVNEIVVTYFSLPGNLSTSRVTVRVLTLDASHNYSFGLYDGSGNLVAHTATGSLPTAGAEQFSWVGGPISLTPGDYMLAFTGDNATAAIETTGSGTPVQLTLITNVSSSTTSSAGVLPSTISVPPKTGANLGNQMDFILN